MRKTMRELIAELPPAWCCDECQTKAITALVEEAVRRTLSASGVSVSPEKFIEVVAAVMGAPATTTEHPDNKLVDGLLNKARSKTWTPIDKKKGERT